MSSHSSNIISLRLFIGRPAADGGSLAYKKFGLINSESDVLAVERNFGFNQEDKK